MKILLLAIALCVMGCQHFQNTIGCYSELELGLGYDHQFGDPSIDGRFDSQFTGHGNPKNHSGGGSGWFAGDAYSDDRVATDVRVHFAPGACK